MHLTKHNTLFRFVVTIVLAFIFITNANAQKYFYIERVTLYGCENLDRVWDPGVALLGLLSGDNDAMNTAAANTPADIYIDIKYYNRSGYYTTYSSDIYYNITNSELPKSWYPCITVDASRKISITLLDWELLDGKQNADKINGLYNNYGFSSHKGSTGFHFTIDGLDFYIKGRWVN